MLYALIGLLVLVGLAMVHPASRTIVGRTIGGLGLFTWAGIRSVWELVTKTAPIIGWILLGLTLAVALSIVFKNLTLLTVLAVILGTFSLILFRASSLALAVLPTPTATSWAVTRLITGLTTKARQTFAGWTITLFFVAVLMLFAPFVVREITTSEIAIIILGASLLGVLGTLTGSSGKVGRKIMSGTTITILAVVIITASIGSLNRQWSKMRFYNSIQQITLASQSVLEDVGRQALQKTEDDILELRRTKVWNGGLKTADQDKLDSLLVKREQQLTAVAESQPETTDINPLPNFNWFTNQEPMFWLIFAGVGFTIFVILRSMFSPHKAH